MVLELRPAHNPQRAFGFVGVVISLENLSSSIWMWYLDTTGVNGKKKGEWKVKKVIEIPAEPADADQLPPLLKGLRCRAAARHGHQPVAQRSLPVRVVLGHG
jgi:selenium-binding protein 1